MKIEIEDNGSGIDSTVLEELNFRLKSPITKRLISTGLEGIALENIAKRIAVSYGKGYGLSVESEKGKGTLVTILLPLISE